jgi:Domain of unknown function (DUF3597)
VGIFNTIMDKIFSHPVAQASAPAQEPAPVAANAPPVTADAPPADAAPAPAPEAGTPPAQVDVGAVLDQMAQAKGGGGNYKSSIVDLLKLLDMDSSLHARKQLAEELNIHAGEDGSAEQNMALHKAVMDQLAAHGGKIPDTLRH